MAITVRQALEIGGLQHGRLLAGSSHLDRVIQHINILEAPWEPLWETQDHLVLTSFYAIRHNPSLQMENIITLAAAGCAALVFQKGVQDVLDPRVIQQAENSGLPLIEVDEVIDYPSIITPLVGAITRENSYLLQRSQDIHRRLTALILGGDGLPAVVKALMDLIERPVVIVNRWGDILAGAASDDKELPLLDEKNYLSDAPHSKSLGLSWHESSGFWIAPLIAGKLGEIEGYLQVLDRQHNANSLDLTAIEQAAAVASLELAKRRAVLETERRLKRDFLDDMLTGEHYSVEAMLARGRSLGWDLLNKRVVMLVDLNRFEAYYLNNIEEGEAHFQQIMQRFLRGVLRVIERENPESIVVERSDNIVVIPHFTAEMPLTQAQRAAKALAQEICATLPDVLSELSISVAIGAFYETVAGLRHSYREATAALEVSAQMEAQPAIILYEDVALYVLLKRFSDQIEVERWRDQTLGRLITYDQNNDTELVKSLEAYFDANQVSQQAARTLFIHPKTLKYRLRRIEEILGIDPFEGDRQLAFYLAAKLTRLQDDVEDAA